MCQKGLIISKIFNYEIPKGGSGLKRWAELLDFQRENCSCSNIMRPSTEMVAVSGLLFKVCILFGSISTCPCISL